MAGAFHDDLETRDPEARERALFAALPGHIRAAMDNAPGWAAHLEGVDPEAVTSRAGLAALPVLRKSDLLERQRAAPPLGGFAATPVSALSRLFMSPGPVWEPEGVGHDWWRIARALFAAGIRPGDIVHNAFGYHLTPGGLMLDSGVRALGCPVVPAGVGNTESQVEAIAHFRPSAYAGTPDFLKVLLDTAAESGQDASSIVKGLVSGGALPASLRQDYDARGVAVLQAYITAELGQVAYESEAREGMIVDEHAILEIVRPGTGEPAPEGEAGEVVVTTFNPDYPMIRLATGDLSAVMPGRSPCGRTNMRIRGWMGRADQATKIKAMFVRPEQVAEIARCHPELGRLRLVVTRENERDVMTLRAECAAPDEALSAKLAGTLQAVTKLKGAVELVAADTLPNDGKVIADERPRE